MTLIDSAWWIELIQGSPFGWSKYRNGVIIIRSHIEPDLFIERIFLLKPIYGTYILTLGFYWKTDKKFQILWCGYYMYHAVHSLINIHSLIRWRVKFFMLKLSCRKLSFLSRRKEYGISISTYYRYTSRKRHRL